MERETNTRTCPYNDQHIIHRSRFAQHVVKCAKNYPPKYKEKCPYNATHIMFRSELEEHMNLCPNKIKITSDLCDYTKMAPSSEFEAALTLDEVWDSNSDRRLGNYTDTSSAASDTDESTSTLYDPVKPPAEYTRPLRPPRVYGVPLMMGFSENGRDDLESVMSTASSSAMLPGGRGVSPLSAVPMCSLALPGRGGGRRRV